MIRLSWMVAIASSVCGEKVFFVNGSFFDGRHLYTSGVAR